MVWMSKERFLAKVAGYPKVTNFDSMSDVLQFALGIAEGGLHVSTIAK